MRKRTLVRAGMAVVTLFAAAQLVQPEPLEGAARKKPPAWENPRLDRRVAGVLQRACADCHSNETRWPWYARVSPASWLLADHVRRGRAQLNLSFSWSIDENTRGEIGDAVSAGTMPPPSYLLLHPEAKLSEGERKLIWDWAIDALGVEGGL